MLVWKTNVRVTRARVGTGALARPAGKTRRRAPRPLAGYLLNSRCYSSCSQSPPRTPLIASQSTMLIGMSAKTQCVAGKVIRVKVAPNGVHLLDFCDDAQACPFTVVIFSNDLKDVGDVRRLAGRKSEIHGEVKRYERRTEIILNHISQIAGGASMIPPLPKNYDVENRGPYSPGRFRPTKKPAKVKATPNITATHG